MRFEYSQSHVPDLGIHQPTEVICADVKVTNPLKKNFLGCQRDAERGAKVAFANSFEEKSAELEGSDFRANEAPERYPVTR